MNTVPVKFMELVYDLVHVSKIKRLLERPCEIAHDIHYSYGDFVHGRPRAHRSDTMAEMENLRRYFYTNAVKLTGVWGKVAERFKAREFLTVAVNFDEKQENHVQCLYDLWSSDLLLSPAQLTPLEFPNNDRSVIVDFHFMQIAFRNDEVRLIDLNDEVQRKELQDFINGFQWDAAPRVVFHDIHHRTAAMDKLAANFLKRASTVILRCSPAIQSYFKQLPHENFNRLSTLETDAFDLNDMIGIIENVNVRVLRFVNARNPGPSFPQQRNLVEELKRAWTSRIRHGCQPEVTIVIRTNGISTRIAEETVRFINWMGDGNHVVTCPVSAEYEWHFALVDYDNAQITTNKRK
ncbi:hypothetical protein QR680_000285 [Steinernema hermaphroditum]|uniref:F-box domain-containing protein n=1 Tax=Steinernema hermaphroditum TaxID=289476 RepID=A0AA39LDW8_9BILA|nr:hypothetical protein QR680_000285 [Steinernema hermaphroditum]